MILLRETVQFMCKMKIKVNKTKNTQCEKKNLIIKEWNIKI